jgi:dimethylhistidine N-methyltransferase
VEAVDFAADVREGLTRRPKRLSSRWFYDDEGSRLFEAIMDLPEYYLSRCEARILEDNREGILAALRGPWFRPRAETPLHVVDLGAGNGAKTGILLSHLRREKYLLSYLPVDVSRKALSRAVSTLRPILPGVPLLPLAGDWLEALEEFAPRLEARKLVLFLGSNIGNLDRDEAVGLLSGLRATLDPGDGLLVGFDLRKDPERILRAYSDSAGVTARFNLNLLTRMNRELGASFRLEDFRHQAHYDPLRGEARSYLVSRRSQAVPIPGAGITALFHGDEPIHTESSHKYTVLETDAMARASGFAVASRFLDPGESFLDALWVPV